MQKDFFVIEPSSSIKDALSLIDKNQSGFVLVCDKAGRLEGTLTDGDIRRTLLKGASIADGIEGIY